MISKRKTLKNKKTNISVIINVHNGEDFIQRAIDSVLAQTYQPCEIIIWYNCSNDETARLVKDYKEVRYFKNDHKTNLGEARELARKVSKGDWISYLDCDDYWYKYKLEKQLPYISENGDVYFSVEKFNFTKSIL